MSNNKNQPTPMKVSTFIILMVSITFALYPSIGLLDSNDLNTAGYNVLTGLLGAVLFMIVTLSFFSFTKFNVEIYEINFKLDKFVTTFYLIFLFSVSTLLYMSMSQLSLTSGIIICVIGVIVQAILYASFLFHGVLKSRK